MFNKQQNTSTLFSLDLEVGNWRWWFGIIIMMVSLFAMVMLSANHHVLIWIVVLVMGLLSLLIKPHRITKPDFGFVLNNPKKLILWVLATVLIFSGLVVAFEHSSPEAMNASKEVMESLHFGERYGKDLLLILTICVFAPINEELIYRGVIFRSIWNSLLKQQWINLNSPVQKKWLAFVVATLIASFMFMSAHGGEGESGGQNTQIYMIFLMGVLACYLYTVTGSIIAPIMFHALNNTFALWQSLHAEHMTFATASANSSWQVIPLEIMMYISPIIAMLTVGLLWLLVSFMATLASQVIGQDKH